ncbi:MAG: stage III sporulation protein AD [Ruminococcaceae bacterium]|nr:stage III sporulation protein AD [Oscillospiraceae bacterium]
MNVLPMIGIALCGTVLALLLRRHHPEFSMAVSIVACVLLFLFAAQHFMKFKDALDTVAERCGIPLSLMTLLYKVVGTAYLGQFSAALCRDAGESALASALEFCTKMMILLMSLPLLTSLFEKLTTIAESI